MNLQGKKRIHLKKTAPERTNEGKWWWNKRVSCRQLRWNTNHFTRVSFDSAVASSYIHFFSLHNLINVFTFIVAKTKLLNKLCRHKKKPTKNPQIHSNSWPGWLCIELHLMIIKKGASRFCHRMRATCFFSRSPLIVNFHFIRSVYLNCSLAHQPFYHRQFCIVVLFLSPRQKKEERMKSSRCTNKLTVTLFIALIYYLCIFFKT